MTEIIDCVAKEKLVIRRYGGDVLLEIRDTKGKLLYIFGIEMKSNNQTNFEKIEKGFEEIKKHIKERPEVFYASGEYKYRI